MTKTKKLTPAQIAERDKEIEEQIQRFLMEHRKQMNEEQNMIISCLLAVFTMFMLVFWGTIILWDLIR